jgi:hypothetical protein
MAYMMECGMMNITKKSSSQKHGDTAITSLPKRNNNEARISFIVYGFF